MSLSLLAAISPLSIPIFSVHLGTSNFDIHTAVFIMLSMYWLTIFMRSARARYLFMAALATALALAIKLTFWFAAPGLLVLWMAALVVLKRARCWRSTVRALVIASLVISLGGAQFARNAAHAGLSPLAGNPEYGVSDSAKLEDVGRVFTFNTLATMTTLMTPEILVKGSMKTTVPDTFRRVAQRLGIELPDARIFYNPERSWGDIFDHLRLPYDSDKAGLGAVVPLVVVPAIGLVLVDSLRRRTIFTIRNYVVVYAFLYLCALSVSLRYSADHVRYLIEPCSPC